MKRFPVSIFTFNELYTVGIRFTDIINPIGNDVFIKAALSALKDKLEALKNILGKSTDKEMTMLLAKKDHLRDKAFVALRDLCKASSQRLKQTTAEAGEYLLNIFKEVGYSLHTQGYAVQSSKMMILFNRLEEKRAAKALDSIGGTEWLEELKSAQFDFEEVYNNKIKDKAALIDYPPKTEIRKDIDKYMEGIISYIILNAESQADTFNQVFERVEELIAEANKIAKARRTRKKNLAEGNENTEKTEKLKILTEFNSELENET